MSDLFTRSPKWNNSGIKDKQREVYAPPFASTSGTAVVPTSDNIEFRITTNASSGDKVVLEMSGVDIARISWGDGVIEEYPLLTDERLEISHAYTSIGEFKISISSYGQVEAIWLMEFEGNAKLIGVESFGRQGLSGWYSGPQSKNIQFIPTEVPESLKYLDSFLAGVDGIDLSNLELWNYRYIIDMNRFLNGARNVSVSFTDKVFGGLLYIEMFLNMLNSSITIERCNFIGEIVVIPSDFIGSCIDCDIMLRKVTFERPQGQGGGGFIHNCQRSNIRVRDLTIDNVTEWTSPHMLYGNVECKMELFNFTLPKATSVQFLVYDCIDCITSVTNVYLPECTSAFQLFSSNKSSVSETRSKLNVRNIQLGNCNSAFQLFYGSKFTDIVVDTITSTYTDGVINASMMFNSSFCENITMRNVLHNHSVSFDFMMSLGWDFDSNDLIPRTIWIDKLDLLEDSSLYFMFSGMFDATVHIPGGIRMGDRARFSFVIGDGVDPDRRPLLETPFINLGDNVMSEWAFGHSDLKVESLTIGDSGSFTFAFSAGRRDIGKFIIGENVNCQFMLYGLSGRSSHFFIDEMRHGYNCILSLLMSSNVSEVNINKWTIDRPNFPQNQILPGGNLKCRINNVHFTDGSKISPIKYMGFLTTDVNLDNWSFGKNCEIEGPLGWNTNGAVTLSVKGWVFGNGCVINSLCKNGGGDGVIMSDFEFGNRCTLNNAFVASSTNSPDGIQVRNFTFGDDCIINTFTSSGTYVQEVNNVTFGHNAQIRKIHTQGGGVATFTNITFGNGAVLDEVFAEGNRSSTMTNWTFGDDCSILSFFGNGAIQPGGSVDNFTFGKRASIILGRTPTRVPMQFRNWSFDEGAQLGGFFDAVDGQDGKFNDFVDLDLSGWKHINSTFTGMLSFVAPPDNPIYDIDNNVIDTVPFPINLIGLDTWDVGQSTRFDRFLKNNDWYNGDLSGWDVKHIPTQPIEFNLNAVIESEHLPKWGE